MRATPDVADAPEREEKLAEEYAFLRRERGFAGARGSGMFDIAIAVLVIALLIGVILSVGRKGRYSEMTEEEFNEEARRVSMRGVGVAEFQKFVDPSHKVEYLQQRDKHVEAEEEDSGDRPSPGEKSKN